MTPQRSHHDQIVKPRRSDPEQPFRELTFRTFKVVTERWYPMPNLSGLGMTGVTERPKAEETVELVVAHEWAITNSGAATFIVYEVIEQDEGPTIWYAQVRRAFADGRWCDVMEILDRSHLIH